MTPSTRRHDRVGIEGRPLRWMQSAIGALASLDATICAQSWGRRSLFIATVIDSIGDGTVLADSRALWSQLPSPAGWAGRLGREHARPIVLRVRLVEECLVLS